MLTTVRWWLGVSSLVLLCAPAFAQGDAPTGSIAGTVTDDRGAPLTGAQLSIDRLGKGAVSGSSGGYLIDAVPAGSQMLRVRLIGYRSQSLAVTVAAGQRATQNFSLAADPLKLDAQVVTANETPRTKLETSNATTVLSAADLTQAAPRSTTEALRYVPGFTRVESSGGEVNENISMRGILGVEYVMFMEDGLPVFPTMHTYFMNADNLIRMDENVDRMEVVRGGSSALYGSNTPGAIINIVNKEGGPDFRGALTVTGATQKLARYDFNDNGPLGQDWRFSLGGFYRYDHGVRDPGYDGIRGGQLKMSLTRQLDNGYVRASLKYIDDRNQFILDLPMQNPSDPTYARGFSNYVSMNTTEGLAITVPIPTGQLSLPLGDGIRTKAVWLTADASFALAGGWNLRNAAQVMQDQEAWNAFVNGAAFGSAQSIANSILAQEGITADSTKLFFTNVLNANGQRAAFDTPNGLLAEMGDWRVDKPLTAFQDQVELRRSFERGDVALGAYLGTYTQGNTWYFNNLLTNVENNPHFVDLVAYSGGAAIPITQNGFYHYLSNYVNGNGQATVFSATAGGSVRLTDRLRADVGARYENDDYVQNSQKDSTYVLGAATVADSEPFGTSTWRHFTRTIGDWAASVGLNYEASDHVAIYVQGNRAYKMPALDDFLNDTAQGQVDAFPPKHVLTGEGGVKVLSGRYGLTVTGFYSILKDISGQGAVIDRLTGKVTWVTKFRAQNRAYGVELEASAKPGAGLSLLGNATILKAELGTGAGADIGSWINGVPPVIGNIAATYSTSGFALLGDWHYVGRRYSDVTKGTALPAYGYVNLGASYTLPGRSMTFSADLLNALQSIGLEEGNPRSLVGVGGNYFFARPILPRRLQAGIRYNF